MSTKPIEERAAYKAIKSSSQTTHTFESDSFAVNVSVEKSHGPMGAGVVTGHVVILEKGDAPREIYSGLLAEFDELAKLVNYARSNAGIPESAKR